MSPSAMFYLYPKARHTRKVRPIEQGGIVAACCAMRASGKCINFGLSRERFLPYIFFLAATRSFSSAMKAVILGGPGGPENMKIGDAPKPTVKDDHVLIKVHATALNRADILQRMGRYPPPQGESEIMGLETSGVVEFVGKNVRKKLR